MLKRFTVEEMKEKRLKSGLYSGFIEYEKLDYDGQMNVVADSTWITKTNPETGDEVMIQDRSSARINAKIVKAFLLQIRQVEVKREEDGAVFTDAKAMLEDAEMRKIIEDASAGLISGVKLGKP